MFWKVAAGLALLSAASQGYTYAIRIRNHNRLIRAIDGETMQIIIGRLQQQQTPLARRLPRYDSAVDAAHP